MKPVLAPKLLRLSSVEPPRRRAWGRMRQRQTSSPRTMWMRQLVYIPGLATVGVHCSPRICAEAEVVERKRAAKPAKAIPCERDMVHSTERQGLMGWATPERNGPGC